MKKHILKGFAYTYFNIGVNIIGLPDFCVHRHEITQQLPFSYWLFRY